MGVKRISLLWTSFYCHSCLCFLPEHAVCLQREIKDARCVKSAFLGSWLSHDAPLKALFKHLYVAAPKDKVWWLSILSAIVSYQFKINLCVLQDRTFLPWWQWLCCRKQSTLCNLSWKMNRIVPVLRPWATQMIHFRLLVKGRMGKAVHGYVPADKEGTMRPFRQRFTC